MTDETPAESGAKLDTPKPGTFKKGFDQRRWLRGAPRKPKDKKRAEELIEHVIWEELSREIDNPNTHQAEDALRLMIRSMIRNKQTQDKILDRIAGKVKDEIEHSGETVQKVIFEYVDNTPPKAAPSATEDKEQSEEA